MWSDLRTYSTRFSSAVLTGFDSKGYPFSVRCTPTFDDEQQVLRVVPVAGAAIEPGKAGLLFHQHNEQLWNLKMFQVLGQLTHDGTGWIFTPERLIPGSGLNSWNDLQAMSRMRQAAKQYLAKRGLKRPLIPWARIRSFYPVRSTEG